MFGFYVSHPATRRRSDVVTTSLCTSQWRRRYVSNETPSDVSVVRLYDVSNKSQMKHPMTSQWYVTKTSQWYVFMTSYWYAVMTSHGDVMTTSHQYVSTTSQTSLKWKTQWRLSATSLRRLSGTSPPRLGVTFSRGLVSSTVSTTFSTSNYFDMTSIW